MVHDFANIFLLIIPVHLYKLIRGGTALSFVQSCAVLLIPILLRMQHLPLPALPPLSQPSAVMQRPTCTGLRVRSPADAHAIFHAVSLNMLPMVSRRLDTEERRTITSGCVFVWEERGSNAEATGVSIIHRQLCPL